MKFLKLKNYILNISKTKSHRYKKLLTRMIKMCCESITLILQIIFHRSLKNRKSPEIWIKVNVAPANEKEDKICLF